MNGDSMGTEWWDVRSKKKDQKVYAPLRNKKHSADALIDFCRPSWLSCGTCISLFLNLHMHRQCVLLTAYAHDVTSLICIWSGPCNTVLWLASSVLLDYDLQYIYCIMDKFKNRTSLMHLYVLEINLFLTTDLHWNCMYLLVFGE